MRGSRHLLGTVAAILLLGACSDGSAQEPEAAQATPVPTPAPICPLSGLEAPPGVDVERPAVGVKIENNVDAYPLSGLDRAEVVYEEEVEGGQTRFLALFHCTDAKRAGSIRSARVIDPAILMPATRILAAAGGNDIVREALEKAGVVIIDEDSARRAMRRIDRPGVSMEHTLFGNTVALRKIGARDYDRPPPENLFNFGDMPHVKTTRASSITLDFSGQTTVVYKWIAGKWQRFQHEQPFEAASGEPIAADNVIIELHTVNYSRDIVDVAGNRSIEIANVTGSGPALLFRDGRVMKGRWVRKSAKSRVSYRTRSGEEMTLKPGTTWIELLADEKGEVRGTYSFRK